MATVALPVEIKSRELYGKTWLGLTLVEGGHDVVVGESRELKMWLDQIQPDVYVTKDVGDTNLEFISQLRSSGIRICGLDPEDGVVGPKRRVNKIENKKKILDTIDVYLSWGETQTEALQNVGGSCRIITTGNPRFDLLQRSLRHIYLEESENHTDKYGEYILINTSFVHGNHYDAKKAREQSEKFSYKNWKEQVRYTSSLRHKFIDSIYDLESRLSDHKLIIRPHPSEDHSLYKKEFRHFDDVVVNYSGDVRSWICGADLVIHNSCTTGIESALLNTPVISYQPIMHDEFDRPLPNLVSKSVYDSEELLRTVSEFLESSSEYEMNSDQRTALKKYIHNIDTLASEAIRDVINELQINTETESSKIQPKLKEILVRNSMALPISEYAESIYGELTGYNKGYFDQKFSGVTTQELTNICSALDQNVSFNTNYLDIQPIGRARNVYLITLK